MSAIAIILQDVKRALEQANIEHLLTGRHAVTFEINRRPADGMGKNPHTTVNVKIHDLQKAE